VPTGTGIAAIAAATTIAIGARGTAVTTRATGAAGAANAADSTAVAGLCSRAARGIGTSITVAASAAITRITA
jgi:hypothetical protein